MKKFNIFIKEQTSDHHQEQLNNLGKQAFNWHLAGRQSDFHVKKLQQIENKYGRRGTSHDSYVSMKNRMSPEDQRRHDFHDQQNNHYNKQMRTTHRHDDIADHMKEAGIDSERINNTLTLARELAHSVPDDSLKSAHRFHDIMGESLYEGIRDIIRRRKKIKELNRKKEGTRGVYDAIRGRRKQEDMLQSRRTQGDLSSSIGDNAGMWGSDPPPRRKSSVETEHEIIALNNLYSMEKQLRQLRGESPPEDPPDKSALSSEQRRHISLTTPTPEDLKRSQKQMDMFHRHLHRHRRPTNPTNEDVVATPPTHHATDDTSWKKYKQSNFIGKLRNLFWKNKAKGVKK